MKIDDIESVAAFVRGLQELTENTGIFVAGGYDGYARLVNNDGETVLRLDYSDDYVLVSAD